MLGGKMGWRWEAGGGITSISHISYPSENHYGFLSLSSGLGLHPLSMPREGNLLTTGEQHTAAALWERMVMMSPLQLQSLGQGYKSQSITLSLYFT